MCSISLLSYGLNLIPKMKMKEKKPICSLVKMAELVEGLAIGNVSCARIRHFRVPYVEARRDRGWKGPGDRDRIRRGRRYGWGPGISFYFSDGYYYGNCGWLKRRAIVTRSPIWWQRYHRCRDFD